VENFIDRVKRMKKYWYQIAFPNPLCFLFEIQRPDWIWNNYTLASVVYKIHLWTCPDLFMDNIELIKRRIQGLKRLSFKSALKMIKIGLKGHE